MLSGILTYSSCFVVCSPSVCRTLAPGSNGCTWPSPVQLEQKSPAFIDGKLTEVFLVDDNGQPVTTVVGQIEWIRYVPSICFLSHKMDKIPVLWYRPYLPSSSLVLFLYQKEEEFLLSLRNFHKKESSQLSLEENPLLIPVWRMIERRKKESCERGFC